MDIYLLPARDSWSNVVVGRKSEALASLIPLSNMMMGVGGGWLGNQEGHYKPTANGFGHQRIQRTSHHRSPLSFLHFSTVLPLFPPALVSSLLGKPSRYTSVPCSSSPHSFVPLSSPPLPLCTIFLFPSLSSMKSSHNLQKN